MKNKAAQDLRAIRTKKERTEKTPEQISKYYQQISLQRKQKKTKAK